MSELKKWENDIYKFDVTESSRVMNPWLRNYGRDKFTFSPEMPYTSAAYYTKYEAPIAHGYPFTAWFQLALVYAAGLYTAKEQGIVKKGVYFQRYWRAHYFDWLLFAKRGAIYGWAGGLVLGTLLVGKPDIAIKRIISKYTCWFTMETTDPRN